MWVQGKPLMVIAFRAPRLSALATFTFTPNPRRRRSRASPALRSGERFLRGSLLMVILSSRAFGPDRYRRVPTYRRVRISGATSLFAGDSSSVGSTSRGGSASRQWLAASGRTAILNEGSGKLSRGHHSIDGCGGCGISAIKKAVPCRSGMAGSALLRVGATTTGNWNGAVCPTNNSRLVNERQSSLDSPAWPAGAARRASSKHSCKNLNFD